MAKCKKCRKKKAIYRDGLCLFCYQESAVKKPIKINSTRDEGEPVKRGDRSRGGDLY